MALEIIMKVEKPTVWVHSLVIVGRKDRILMLCLDPKESNKYARRVHFPMPTREEIFK